MSKSFILSQSPDLPVLPDGTVDERVCRMPRTGSGCA
jgi:hypothetical protein